MSSDDEFEQFEKVNSGASETFPLPVNDLKVGGYAMLKNFPCRIVDIAISKTGKHGHAKAAITGLDIFTSKKYEEVYPTSHTIQSFTPKKLIYQLVNLEENQLTLIDDNNNTREDLDLPEDQELTENIKKLFASGESVLITVLSAIGKEQVIDCKKE